MSTDAPRIHQSFEEGWHFHLGEVGRVPRQGSKAAGLTGLTNLLDDEKPKTGQSNQMEEFFAKLSQLPAFQSFAGNPAPADKETGWKDVRLPHDWKVDLPYSNDKKAYGQTLVTQGYKPSGVGYYRKLFAIPAEWDGQKIAIEFDGIMGASTIWVNSVCLGEHWSGYTSFYYDVTDILNYGEEGQNAILIRVDTADAQGWWYEGAGIYRHAWLTVTGPLRVEHWGVFVTTPRISPDEAVVRAQVTVENGYPEGQAFSLKTTLLGPDGHVTAGAISELQVDGLSRSTVTQELSVLAPRLWSLDAPALYQAVTEIVRDGQVVDSVVTPFGIREIAYTREGLFINGQPTLIKGACLHQDFAGVGIAMPDRAIEYRLEKLKAVGCNAYRSAHHPATPELLDACDRLGVLVLDENRLLESTAYGLEELEHMILRDRNHPCVFMWSLSNEERVAGTPKGRRLYRAMVNHARVLDPTRLLTTATSGGEEDAAYMDIADVAGYNYAPSTRQYGLARRHFEAYPERRFMGTEDACAFTTRGIYLDDPQKGWCSSFGSRATLLGDPHPAEGIDLSQFMDISALARPEKTWQHTLENPFMGGVFIWTGFDYRGEPFPWMWPQSMHQGGIYDLCGFEKDATYFYKAIWKDGPVVHIMPHWDWPERVGQVIPVRTYTNVDEVELWVNGQSQGRKKPDDVAQVNWQVVYTPGVIEARGYRKGVLAASDRRETTSAPAYLRVTADRPSIRADGKDLAMITVEVLDGEGRVSPTACPDLAFKIAGPAVLIGVGNGDPASHEPDHASSRRAFNGLCLGIIQSTREGGHVSVAVSAPGLIGGQTMVETV